MAPGKQLHRRVQRALSQLLGVQNMSLFSVLRSGRQGVLRLVISKWSPCSGATVTYTAGSQAYYEVQHLPGPGRSAHIQVCLGVSDSRGVSHDGSAPTSPSSECQAGSLADEPETHDLQGSYLPQTLSAMMGTSGKKVGW